MSINNRFSFHPAKLDPKKGNLPERSTAGAFLVKGGEVLLEKRPDCAKAYSGYWDTPGGHLEPGEAPEAALIREMKEELDIIPGAFFLATVQDDLDPGTGMFYRHYVYIVHSWSGDPISRENRTINWFSFTDALDLDNLNPLIGFALKDFMEKGWIK